jgi:hypothetical protein
MTAAKLKELHTDLYVKGCGLVFLKPDYNITFSNDKGVVGKLDFNGPEMVFTGNAEESAKLFFNYIATSFKARLEQERNEAIAAFKEQP